MAKFRFLALVLLSAAGLALSGYLVWQHAHFLFSGKTGGLCELVKQFDCSRVESSAFSEVLGTPTASFGVLYFFVFMLYLLGFRPADPADQRFRHGAALLNAAGVSVSLALGAISLFVIKSLCLGCVLTYSINALMLIALVPWRRPWTHPLHILRGFAGLPSLVAESLKSPDAKLRGRAAGSMALLALVAVVNFYAVPKYIAIERLRVIITRYDQTPTVEIPVHDWNLTQGAANAPIQIVKFTDFQCPTCMQANRDLEELLSEYDPSAYRLVYKNFPLDRKCNRLVAEQGPDFNLHAGSCELALMAQGAGSLGGFWNIAALLYGAKEFAPDGIMSADSTQQWLSAMAEKGNMNLDEWMRFSKSGINQQRVVTDIEDGIKLMLSATPAIFINGRRAPGTKRPDLKALLEHVAR